MRVLLDVDAIAPPLTGIGRYALALAQGLQKSRRIQKVEFFTVARKFNHLEDLLQEERTLTKLKRNIPATRVMRKLYHLAGKLQFKSQIKPKNFNLFHSPNHRLLPFNGNTVSTFHDLSLERFPEFHPPQRLQIWRNEILPTAARASHIITDSEFVRQEVMEFLKVSSDRVTAVPLGVGMAYRDYNERECTEVLARFGLRYGEFCLVVSTIEPRKNFERLLKAFENLPAEIQKSFPLAIAGAKGWLNNDIHVAIDRLITRGAAIRLGYVAETDLPRLYAAAAVMTYPTLYEGFGLPILEAMASGTAVLTSNCSSIPEVAGNACQMVDPYSVEAISAGLQQILEDNMQREQLERAGLMQAKKFTWQKCVDQTIDVYEKLTS